VVYGYKNSLNETKGVEPLTNDDDFEDDDAIEDAYFMKILKERENEATIPLDDLIARFNAKHPEHAVL
jgi:hypothetical protein